MKPRYIIGGVVAVILAVVGFMALNTSSVEYADVERAERLGKTVQVVGTWVKEEGSSYDAHANIFRFTMKDDRNFPLDLAGGYSVNTAIAPRFAAMRA